MAIDNWVLAQGTQGLNHQDAQDAQDAQEKESFVLSILRRGYCISLAAAAGA
jgi:hypothetical protein